MQNALNSPWQTAADETGPVTEDRPRRRLAWLAAVWVLLLTVVAGRLSYVQCVLPEGLLLVFDETTTTEEEIPARDGRIVSADGITLADNEERSDLLVHYRWIEEPAQPEWLRHRAGKRLHRSERRNKERWVAAEAEVLRQRDEMWAALSELTQHSPDDLRQRRARIQDRVERIWQRVQDRRSGLDVAAVQPAGGNPGASSNPVGRAWSAFWHEVTTPPQRTLSDPLVIAEQEDDHVLLEGIEPEIAAEIEARPERFPGVRVVIRTRRVYPQNDLAAHLVGNRLRLKPEDLAESRGTLTEGADLQPGDSIGRSGLERSYDALLRGRRGVNRIVRDRRREIVKTEVVREPRAGQDLVLTFAASLQGSTERLLDRVLQTPPEPAAATVDDESNRSAPPARPGPRGACLVALDVRTGAVLAAAAAPRYDLNLLVETDDSRWQAVLQDPQRPLFPRVTQMALPPGSTFKTLSAIALVEDGGLDPEARFVCQGYLDRPDKDRCLVYRHYGVGHQTTDLADALCRSCNVYFFTAARQAGPAPLVEWAKKFGIGQPTGIDLPGESAGMLPTPDLAGKGPRRRWYPGDTLGLVIGQSSLLVTPLQLARVMAAVANGGELITPHLAARAGIVHQDLAFASRTGVVTASSTAPVVSTFAKPIPRPISGLHQATLAVVQEGLERVVQDRRGTAYKTVRLPNVRIAGKTGTAEVGGRLPDHAWFAGYVPADDPRVAFVVVIEHGGSGGKVAGPTAREFVQLLLAQGVIQPTQEVAREQSP